MTEYRLPGTIHAIVFDIDRTLYTNETYAEGQIEGQYRCAAQYWGVPVEEARARVGEWRAEYSRRNNGAATSLGNTLAGLGVPIETSVKWREEQIDPGLYLSSDPDLVAALSWFARRLPLLAVTNNPVKVGQATLDVLGVSHLIGGVVGLDTTWKSKPDPEPFREALRRLGTAPETTVSVGDRYDVDIEPALSIGMAGVLVDGVAEVHHLPSFLADRMPEAGDDESGR